MTLAELRLFIRQQLRETYQQAFDDLTINARINYAYQELARYGFFLRDTRPIISDTAGVVTFPPNYIVPPLQVLYNNNVLSRVDVKSLDAFIPGWRTMVGSAPQYWFFIPPNQIQLVPRPSSGTWSVSVDAFFVPYPNDTKFPTLVNDTDTPMIPAAYHVAIAYRAIMELAAMAPEDQTLQARAQYYASLYNNILQEIVMRYRQPIDTRGLDLPVFTPTQQERR